MMFLELELFRLLNATAQNPKRLFVPCNIARHLVI